MKTNLAARLFATFTTLVGVLAGSIGLSCAHADQGGVAAQIVALQSDVQTLRQQGKKAVDQLNAAIAQLTAVVNSQSQLISLLQQQNQDLQAKLGCMSKTGEEVYFTGCNLHIVSGSGATDGTVNGLGNLIIGYNEDAASLAFESFPPNQRSGSHNLVVGPGHSYTSFGGLVAGRANSITGRNATVSGGGRNTAHGWQSSVSGGSDNTADGLFTGVSGGGNNFAADSWASISGGDGNIASGVGSSICGGYLNKAQGVESSISGGSNNIAVALRSSISGGSSNQTTNGAYSSISGGQFNTASSYYSSVSGGQSRTAPNDFHWAAGGLLQNQ